MADANQHDRKEKMREVFKRGSIILLATALLLLLPLLSSAQISGYPDITQSALDNPQEEYKATQLPAEVGKPVHWTKQVDVQNLYDEAESEIIVNIPPDAQNIQVTDLNTGTPKAFVMETDGLRISDTLAFNEQRSYLIQYETPSPDLSETGLVRDGDALVKNVIVSSDYHYEDVLTFTDIPELNPADAKYNIMIYWTINGVKTEVTDDPAFNLKFYDTDGNGKYDRVSWITPHLSTQIFEVVVYSDADPGNYSSIGLTLLDPSDGEYITSNSRIGFNYSVSYNSSTAVFCNLTVDGQVRRENTPTTSDILITTYFNISSGNHTWGVTCAGSDGIRNTSENRHFTVDLDAPLVTLNTPDYYVSNTNTADLNFTPVDERYPVLVCSLSVNGALNQTNIIVNNATKRT
ncbi:hypothetical protein KY363_06325, partial [Candidatus Woesearchaeota archaeon]|nr:hypothetical protein [Candidatus Woesearchaeota archaeon]